MASIRSSSKLTAISLAAVLVFTGCSVVQRILPLRDVRTIVVLHTNDVHGNFRPIKATWIKSDSPVWVGGSASMASFVNGWRDRVNKDRLLLVDAGDIFQGTPEGNETKGELAVRVMNRLGYDFMAIGNHEFDYGIDNLKKLVAMMNFPAMAENIRETATGKRPPEVAAPTIIERNGVRIGIFGLITQDLAKVTALDEDAEWGVVGEVPTAAATAKMLRDSGAEMVLMVTHCGITNDSLTAFFLEQISEEDFRGSYGDRPLVDVIVGGHSHTAMETPVIVGGAVIVQAGSRGTAIGELQIGWDKSRSRLRDVDYRLVTLYQNEYPPDPEMEVFLEPFFGEIDRVMNEIVGSALGYFWKQDRDTSALYYSSPLGNLQTDIVRAATGVDIVFQNKGGIRAPISTGKVRLRDLYAVSPFGNSIVTFKMTGKEIKEIVQASLTESQLGGGYTPLEISGVVVYYDPARPGGDRLVNILVGGAALDEKRVYRVAANSFLAGGGDGYPQFKNAREVSDSGKTLLSYQVDFFKQNREGVAPDLASRWKAVYEP